MSSLNDLDPWPYSPPSYHAPVLTCAFNAGPQVCRRHFGRAHRPHQVRIFAVYPGAYSHISCISAYSRTFVSSNYAPVNRIYPINTSTKLMFEWDAMAADAYGVAMLAAILASAAASCIVKRTQERRVRMPTHKRAVGCGKPQRWPTHVRGAGLSNPAGSRPEEQRPARSKRRARLTRQRPAPVRDLERTA